MPRVEILETPPGYRADEAARFIWQMDNQTARLLKDTENATPQELAWQSAPGMNTVGMLLAHIAIAEVFWTQVILEEKPFDCPAVIGIGADDDGLPLPPDGLPPAGLAGKNIAYFRDLLDRSRQHLQKVARELSAADLVRHVPRIRKDGTQDTFDKAWVLYHLLEHEAAHYGQIALIRHAYRAMSAGRMPSSIPAQVAP